MPSQDVDSRPQGTELMSLDMRLGARASSVELPDHPGEDQTQPSPLRKFLVGGAVCGAPFLNSMQAGLLTVGLPTIATDLGLTSNLLLWPASVYALSCGCSLLLFGSIADVVGTRLLYLIGCGALAATTLASALARTGIELIFFRAVSGLAISCCLTSAVSIVTITFDAGKARNIAFSCLGAAQPVGYSLGLVCGGVLCDTVGWRYGFYLGLGTNVLTFIAAFISIPHESAVREVSRARALATHVDWLGNILASTAMAFLSYVLASVTSSSTHIKEPLNISLICVAVGFFVSFYGWMHYREKRQLSAIMPNSLWKNLVFTSVCVAIFLAWSTQTTFQYFVALYFQKVENLTAIQTSLRLIPMVVAGVLTNIATGMLVPRVSANVLVLVTGVATALSSIFMAINQPTWSYWYLNFAAIFLAPINSDVLFTVGNLIITSVFPQKTHSVAGGVFNTVAQIGNSVGLAFGAVLASAVTMSTGGEPDQTALLKGYRATFWMCFAGTGAVMVVSALGLRGAGRVGIKRD